MGEHALITPVAAGAVLKVVRYRAGEIMSFGSARGRDTIATLVRALLAAVGLLAITCTAPFPPGVLDAPPSLDRSRAISQSTEHDDFPLDPEAPLDLRVGPEIGR